MKLTEGRLIVGQAGRGIEILMEREPTDRPDLQGTIGAWFLQCPGQSPAWQHYHLSMIHLRPIEGVKPAAIRREGATHELMLLALDSQKHPTPINPESWSYLSPYNLEEQVILKSDGAAAWLLDHAAEAIVHGMLWAEPPFSHQVSPWREWLRNHEGMKSSEQHLT